MSFKIKNFFSFKDPIPDAIRSFVVYQFTCAGCNSCYIGESSRHFSTRIKQHTLTDKNSHVFKHLNSSSNCKNLYTSECFKMLDSAKTVYFLKLKEAFYINSFSSAACQHLLILTFCFISNGLKLTL